MRRLLLLIFLTVSIIAGADDYIAEKDDIWQLAYSNDGKHIAVIEFCGLIKIQDSTTFDIVKSFNGNKMAVQQIIFSPDDLYIAVCTDEIFIFEIETGNIISRLTPKSNNHLTSISYRFDGQRIVSGSREGLISVWDTINEVEIMTLNNPRRWVTNVSYSTDGNKILSVYGGNSITIWDANSGAPLKTLTDQNVLTTHAFAVYNHNGTKILVSYWNHKAGFVTIDIYDSNNYELLYSNNIESRSIIIEWACFLFDSNNIILYSYSYKRLIIMEYTNGSVIHSVDFDDNIVLSSDGKNVLYVKNRKNMEILTLN